MGDRTLISWAEKTFNPWIGCAKVSAACKFCYMFRDLKRYGQTELTGRTGLRRITADSYWKQPAGKWKRDAAAAGRPLRVFCASWADVFEDFTVLPNIDPDLLRDLEAARTRLFALVEATPWLTWMILTKRPENAERMIPDAWQSGWPPNVWFGASMENQRFAEQRMTHLVQAKARIRFISAEPLLGPIDLTRIAFVRKQQPDMVYDALRGVYGVPGQWQAKGARPIEWLITGAESGHQAAVRPTHPEWLRDLRDQAVRAGVPFHHKQNGEWTSVRPRDLEIGAWEKHPERHIMMAEDGRRIPLAQVAGLDERDGGWVRMYRAGASKTGRELDGKVWDEFPASHALVGV
jgi:protein gp37